MCLLINVCTTSLRHRRCECSWQVPGLNSGEKTIAGFGCENYGRRKTLDCFADGVAGQYREVNGVTGCSLICAADNGALFEARRLHMP